MSTFSRPPRAQATEGAGSESPSTANQVRYDKEVERIATFMENFIPALLDGATQSMNQLSVNDVDDDEENMEENAGADRQSGGPKYMRMLQAIADRKTDALEFSLEDFYQFYKEDREGMATVMGAARNALRYIDLVAQAADRLMPPTSLLTPGTDSVLEVMMGQREQRDAARGEGEMEFPPILMRRYNVVIHPRLGEKSLAVRDIRASDIGRLVSVRGIVTRISDVRPLLLVCAYNCDACGAEVFQEVKGRQYTPLAECPSDSCTRNNVRGRLHLQTRGSKFQRFQEMRIQETPDQVPVGHIPRTLTVHLVESLTRTCTPGDVVHLAGIFLPAPYTGFRAMKAGLIADTFLQAQRVEQTKKAYSLLRPSAAVRGEVRSMVSRVRGPNGGGEAKALYSRLARSIAPEIYGLEDVKKALLLLLVGGVGKRVGDGMKIRGDVNVCLMGDPGVAKSQLLRFVCRVAPRGVYTTGKGSSGVGLTAAVMRDPVTDEMVLEGGALVLADNGICCIDEFDKMEEGDRAGIHEVMEQQTCSISKAGITTTLNARTSILAAANPAFGRYNPHRTPEENINLPAALLSRFDILFLMLDTPDRSGDERLAHHVTQVHASGMAPMGEGAEELVGIDVLRQYIAEARQCRPVVPPSVGAHLVGVYVNLRKQDGAREGRRGAGGEDERVAHASPRTLLGLTRLAQAHARLALRSEVEMGDVEEAVRLIDSGRSSIARDTGMGRSEGPRGPLNPKDQIYHTINQMRVEQGNVPSLLYSEILAHVRSRGYSEEQLGECIQEYESLSVWSLNIPRTRLTFVHDGN